jgi:hypothetical protein
LFGWEIDERQGSVVLRFPAPGAGELLSLTAQIEGSEAGTCLEDITSVFKVHMRHSSRDKEQAVCCVNKGSKGRHKFQIRSDQ